MRHTRTFSSVSVISLLAGLSACQSDKVSSPRPESPSLEISDGAHAGNQRFFFLPPMVSSPAYSGVFDASQHPVVRIAEGATQVVELNPAVDVAGETYQAEWHTSEFALDASKTYRITVSVDGFTVGFADVDVVKSGAELKNVNTGEFIPLKDGRTLPIKFRLERGVLDCNCWTILEDIPTARTNFASAALNGNLYVLGGLPTVPPPYATVEAYSPSSRAWITRAPMPTARVNFGAVSLNGSLFAIGGDNLAPCSCPTNTLRTVEIYNPTTDSWSAGVPMPTARSEPGVAALDGVIYVVGGYTWVSPSQGLRNTAVVEAFDVTTGVWSTKAPLPVATKGLAVVAADGVLYAIGGMIGDQATAAVYGYDPQTNSWIQKASMPVARHSLQAAVLNGRIYAIGGYNQNGGSLSAVEAYDPTSDSWSPMPSMLRGRAAFGAHALNGRIYAVAGSPLTSSMEVYRP